MRQRLGTERGTSTLEFIVVLPFLLLIMLVGVELSRAWLTAHIASSAVREGARRGAVTPVSPDPPYNMTTWAQTATDRITDVLSAANLTALGAPTVGCTPTPCAPNSQVDASVTVRFQTVVPLFLPQIAQIDITQSATMRYE
jgi:Flp pilus assembly protein TadG